MKFWVAAILDDASDVVVGEMHAEDFDEALENLRITMVDRFAGKPGRVTCVVEWPENPLSCMPAMAAFAAGAVQSEARMKQGGG